MDVSKPVDLAHELHTPISAILGHTNQLLEDFQGPPETLEKLLIIRNHSDYLLRLTAKLLARSNVGDVSQQLAQAWVAPLEVIADVIRLMRVVAERKGLSLTFDPRGEILTEIQCDETSLRQILINLIGNALKYTNEGGIRVLVESFATDEERACSTRISVIDTGIGMTAEQLSRLFQPFVQVHASSVGRGGTGVGLATAKRLTLVLGGDLTATSLPGQGSTFAVNLPGRKQAGDGSSGFIQLGNPESRPLAGFDILLAEDSSHSQLLIAVLLKKAGASVTLAHDGRSACDLALFAHKVHRCFRVVLMDVHMPGADGPTAARQLRAAGYDGVIIGISSNGAAAIAQLCHDSGMDGFLPKPFTVDQLTAALRLVTPRQAQ